MTANDDLARQLSDHYAAEAPTRAPDWLLDSALRSIETSAQRRVLPRLPRRAPVAGHGRLAMLTVAVAAAAFVVGGILFYGRSHSPSVGGPASSGTPGATSVAGPSRQPLSTAGLTPDVLVGRWVADRHPQGMATGKYELILAPNEAKADRSDGTPLQIALGDFDAVQADVVEFGPSSTCDGPGSYRWTIGVSADPGSLPGSRPRLDLRPVEDSCVARLSFLEGSWEAWPQPAVGRRSVTVDGVLFSFDVRLRYPGSGWAQFGNISISRSITGPQGAEGIIYWTSVSDRGLGDPCADVLNLPVDASADDLASAVAAAPGIELVSGPSEVILGGRPARHVVVTVHQDLGCDPGYFYSWQEAKGGPFWGGTTAGDTISIWIVDVDGKRLFIAAETHVDSGDPQHVLVGPTFKQEVDEIVDSIQFE